MAMEPIAIGPDSMTRRMNVDLSGKDLKNVSIGSKVRVVTTGVVTELRGPEKYTRCCDGEDKEEIIPPRMCIQVDSTKVAVIGNEQIDSIVESDVAEEYD